MTTVCGAIFSLSGKGVAVSECCDVCAHVHTHTHSADVVVSRKNYLTSKAEIRACFCILFHLFLYASFLTQYQSSAVPLILSELFFFLVHTLSHFYGA